MDISTTSNLFIMAAEAICRQGEDMEIVARHLAEACVAVMADGLGADDKELLTSEFIRLAFT